MRDLRQEHRAELAGADQRCACRLAGGIAGLEEGEEVHGRALYGLLSFRGVRDDKSATRFCADSTSPESILTLVAMDSGLIASRCPGMTKWGGTTPPPGGGRGRAA